MSKLTKNNNHKVANLTPRQNELNTNHWLLNQHSKQLYHQVYICKRYLPQLNDLSTISLGTRVCYYNNVANWMEIKQYPIHHHFFFNFQKSISLLNWMRKNPIRRFQQLAKVQITFELNEETTSHPFSSFIIIMDMINNSSWPFNRSEFIRELAHSIWSCNHNQLIGNHSMLIISVTMQVHCRVLGTTLFPSISKINLRLMLQHFQ